MSHTFSGPFKFQAQNFSCVEIVVVECYKFNLNLFFKDMILFPVFLSVYGKWKALKSLFRT